MLRLVNDTSYSSGTAWYDQRISTNDSFDTTFQFDMHDGSSPPADGMAFVIQNDPAGSGAVGQPGYIGYWGITNSVEIEFDIFPNDFDPTPQDNHVAILQNGDPFTHLASADPGFPLYGSGPFTAWVDYDSAGKDLKVYAAQSATKPTTPLIDYSIDLPTMVGGTGLVGLVGGSGGETAVEDADSWRLAGTLGTISDAAIFSPYQATDYTYKQVESGQEPDGWQTPGFDDSVWNTGDAAFSANAGCVPPSTVATRWDANTSMLLRKNLSLPAGTSDVSVGVAVDNDTNVYWNGQLIGSGTHDGCPTLNDFVFPVPNESLTAGNNLLAVEGIDRGGFTFLDVSVTGLVGNTCNAGNDPSAPASGVTGFEAVLSQNRLYNHIPVAALNDVNNSLPPTSYAATIDWGEGHVTQGAVVAHPNGYCVIYGDPPEYGIARHYKISIDVTATGVDIPGAGIAEVYPQLAPNPLNQVGVLTSSSSLGGAQCTATVVSSTYGNGIPGAKVLKKHPPNGDVVVTARHCLPTWNTSGTLSSKSVSQADFLFAPGHVGVSPRYSQDYSTGTVSYGPYATFPIGPSPLGVWKATKVFFDPNPADDIAFLVMKLVIAPTIVPRQGDSTLEKEVGGGLPIDFRADGGSQLFDINAYDAVWADTTFTATRCAPDQFCQPPYPSDRDPIRNATGGTQYASEYPVPDGLGQHLCSGIPLIGGDSFTGPGGGFGPRDEAGPCNLGRFSSGAPFLDARLSPPDIDAVLMGTNNDSRAPCCYEVGTEFDNPTDSTNGTGDRVAFWKAEYGIGA